MKIENDTLIIDEPLDDDALEETKIAINQEGLRTIKVQNDNISSSIVQLLWCVSEDKKTEI